MPWLKLKKSRRYNIASKNQFLVSVILLDNTNLECTLTTDSSGQECLESVAQRIELNSLDFFGLRYVSKKRQFRWIELDKPLKKQLDKHAHSPQLYFGTVYYVDNVHNIQDEMTRYLFFLQLRTDVIEGKLPCTTDQAIMLASYSLQAEYGDHDYERHTQDYLKEYSLLPKNMTPDDQALLELTEQVAVTHRSLQGMFPAVAEVEYLKEVQKLQGFGEEYHKAKDEVGTDLLLGTSHQGFYVKQLDGQTVLHFPWTDVGNVVHNKRVFGIQVKNSEEIINFQTDEPDSAKYVWRMCLLQMHFHKTHKNVSRTATPIEGHMDGSIPDIQQSTQIFIKEDDQDSIDGYQQYSEGQSQTSLNQFHPEGHGYPNGHIIPNGIISTEGTPVHSTQVSNQNLSTQDYLLLQQQEEQKLKLQQEEERQKAELAYKAALLPAYRPSPNYEDVMKQRILQHNSNITNISSSQVYNNHTEHSLAYSQPEIRRTEPIYANQEEFMNHVNRQRYDHVINNEMQQPEPRNRAVSLNIHPTYSTPDLTMQQYSTGEYNNEQLMTNAVYNFKPPPPYPKAAISTPDLACQTHPQGNLSSSPDLVSRRNLPPLQTITQTQYRSVENLATFTFDSVEEIEIGYENEARGQLEQQMTTESHIRPPPPYRPPENGFNPFAGMEPNTTYQVMNNGAQQLPHIHIASVDNVTSDTTQLGHDNPQMDLQMIRHESPQMDLLQQQMQNVHVGVGSNTGQYHYSDSSADSMVLQHQQVRPINPFDPNSPVITVTVMENPVPPVAVEHSHINDNASPVQETDIDAVTTPRDEVAEVEPNILEAAKGLPDSSSDTDSIQCLDTTKISLDASHSKQSSLASSIGDQKSDVMGDGIKRRSKTKKQPLDVLEDSDEGSSTLKRRSIGPLRLAAMNGLTMSRPHLQPNENDETRAPKDDRRKTLEEQLEQGHVFLEFEEVPRKIPTLQVCSLASERDNVDKNRFKDVVPYEHNMIKLKPIKKNKSGYINASNIKLKIGNDTIHYIASQGPMKNTVQDFWAMVWENDVQVIAMLTEVEEGGKEKCALYWPTQKGPKNKVKFGEYEVSLKFANDSLCYITCGFTLKHLPSKQSRMVWHLQYTDWPESGYPDDIYGFLSYLDEIESVYRHARGEGEVDERPLTPIVVHCSAGVGRTGVLILTEIMKMMLEHNQKLDVKAVLTRLRAQRMHMVQSVGQYSFVHKALIQYLKNSRLI